MSKRPVLRRTLIGLGVATLVGLTALAVAIVWLLRGTPLRGAEFTPQAWHDAWRCSGLGQEDCARRRAECHRGPMLQSLLAGPLSQPNLDRESVATLLGAPNGHSMINDSGRMRSCDIWLLGVCSGIGIDEDALYVCFDPDGTLTSAGHLRT